MRAYSTPQALSFRCQLILRAAALDRPSNLQVAKELHCDRHTVGRWRSRYLEHGLRGLQDAPRPGRPQPSSDFAAHLANVVKQLPDMKRYDWVVDNFNTHWSLDVCRVVAPWCKVPFGAKDLSRGVQRRAFLSDPSHPHVFQLYAQIWLLAQLG